MRYISCFSGIGGLEARWSPEAICEIDFDIRQVLHRRYPDALQWDDICTFHPPNVEVVAGGWPCQDISIAGQQVGLAGSRSGLLTELIRVALEAKAHSIVAENVPNLLRLNQGRDFRLALDQFAEAGYRYIGWRVLNAREFGLPQNRSRVLIVASREREYASSLFRAVPQQGRITGPSGKDEAAGFYWTGGTHSINYTNGYVPAIKIGSSLGISSPPAVHYSNVVRLLSPNEALALQGFDLREDEFPSRSLAYRAAGNAVAKPIGSWVFDGLASPVEVDLSQIDIQASLFRDVSLNETYPKNGFYDGCDVGSVEVPKTSRASNLSEYLDKDSEDRLSIRAASGLLRRLTSSRQHCPNDLWNALNSIVDSRT